MKKILFSLAVAASLASGALAKNLSVDYFAAEVSWLPKASFGYYSDIDGGAATFEITGKVGMTLTPSKEHLAYAYLGYQTPNSEKWDDPYLYNWEYEVSWHAIKAGVGYAWQPKINDTFRGDLGATLGLAYVMASRDEKHKTNGRTISYSDSELQVSYGVRAGVIVKEKFGAGLRFDATADLTNAGVYVNYRF